MNRSILCVSLCMLMFTLACGDDSSGDGGVVDGGLDGPDAVVHCGNGVFDGDELDVDCGGSCAACQLLVESSEPGADEEAVELDRTLRIVFSRELDSPLSEDAVVVETSAGERVAGRIMTDRRTLLFTPTRYAPNDVHTVIIGTAVTSGVYAITTPQEFNFTTGETTSDSANPPPEGYDPLGPSTQTSLGRMPEYALVWTGSDDTHFALEDPPYNPSPMMNRAAPDAEGMDSVANIPALRSDKRIVTAQLDDDGEQEVAIFSADATGEIGLVVVDRTSTGITSVAPALSFALADTFEVDAGDFDRDGRDELLLGISRAGERIRYYLVEYDPISEAYSIALSGEIASEGTTNAEYVRVAAGDIDHDGKAEAVIAWHIADRSAQTSDAYYVVLDDADHGLAEAFPFRIIKEDIRFQSGCHDSYIDLTTGDVDDDGADEIIFSIYEPRYLRQYWGWWGILWVHLGHDCSIDESLMIADGIDAETPSPPSLQVLHDDISSGDFRFLSAWVGGGALTRRHRPVLEAGDLDGAPGDEVLLHNHVFKLRIDSTTGGFELADGWPLRIPDEIVHFGPAAADNYAPMDFADGGITMDVGIGDIDGDLKQDVVLLRKSGGEVWVDHFDLDAGDGSAVLFTDLHTGLQRSTTYDSYAGRPLLALPNVDQDSVIVERESHDVYLGDNVIIALLAAAPCSEAIGQDIGSCVTEFGQGTTETWVNGVFVSASVGITAGFEWEPEVPIPFMKVKIAKVELEIGFGLEGSYQHSWSTGISEQVTYAAGADNNLIVFKTHVYDRYVYRILAHPDPTRIDSTMTLSVPSGYRTLAVSQEYYNGSNGEQMDIDASVMDIVPGDLTSYPREGAARELAALPGNRLIAISSSVVSAPEGQSNAIGVELGISTGESDEFSVGLYLNASLKACGPEVNGWNPTVCVGVEESRGIGYAHAHEWSSELIFAGSLAGIPADQFAESGYAAGLYAYETSINDDLTGETQNFIVVSYYVQ